MLLLPTFNATLTPCPVGPAAFGAHEKGHFCGSCQRVVQDFSRSTHPVADLAAARAAAPDGRVCGMFRRAQTTALPPLTRRLRWFLVALVLVLGQGLTAREALAQVRRSASKPSCKSVSAQSKRHKQLAASAQVEPREVFFGVVVEQMPTFRGGSNLELVKYIQQQIVWPVTKYGKMVQTEGRIFASFTVGVDGKVHDPKIVKGLQPLFDAEVLRVLRAMPSFRPGRQNGKPNAVSMVVPVSFKLE